ncbi:MAG: glycosyltransferase N-terminal domain-containing protein [Myxococcota bacterium]|nr:glycosyltransferase N-terminal domain-containing protein [Myxococcota bacterium]
MIRIWIHGASVGDMRSIEPLFAQIIETEPAWKPMVTAWTDGGRRLGRTLYGQAFIGRPPLPIRSAVKRFIKKYQIELVILEYLELYPAWVDVCHDLGIPIAILNGRVSQKSLRIRRLLSRCARKVSLFCARTTEDANAAIQLGVCESVVHVTGNGKYDGLAVLPQLNKRLLSAQYGSPNVVIGSLHPDEESAAVDALARTDLRAIVAPRYVSQTKRLKRRLQRLGLIASRESRNEQPARVHLLDTYGQLAAVYGTSNRTIVGGTFGRRGGQNLFEAALHNNIVIHGPSTSNVQAEVDLFRSHGAYLAEDWTMAFSLVQAELPPSNLRQVALSLRGATMINIDLVRQLTHRFSTPNA